MVGNICSIANATCGRPA